MVVPCSTGWNIGAVPTLPHIFLRKEACRLTGFVRGHFGSERQEFLLGFVHSSRRVLFEEDIAKLVKEIADAGALRT